ncbi:MAG: Ig-like domain-containing protein [Limisphaerales bacterium]
MPLNCGVNRRGGHGRRWTVWAALLGLGLGLGSEALAQGAPNLVSSDPADGATGVSVTSALVFVFDQAMEDTPIVPTVPGFFVGNLEVTPASVAPFDCEWSEDLTTLTCGAGGDLPPNTTVNWKLNPAGALLPILSAGGTALATTTGSFTTGAGSGGGGGGGGGGGEEGPALVSTTPADGATGVAVTASVRFVFDQPMQKNPAVGGAPPFAPGAVRWTGTGLDPAKFTYSWSADGITLTAEYTGDLPGTTEISWVLNPANALVKLMSEAEELLPDEVYSGAFTTGTGAGGGGGECDPSGTPSGWGAYTLTKYLSYVQGTAGDPVAASEEPFRFGATVKAPEVGPAVLSATVTIPPNRNQNLEAIPIAGILFYNDTKDTPAELNAAYPGGGYTLRFTQDGQAERVVLMTMPSTTPPVPRIGNLAEAQAIDVAQPFTLRWNAFTGAAPDDIIFLSIMDRAEVVFQAPNPCVPVELASSATSIVIPAHTLVSNQTYTATLAFADTFHTSTNTVPNMSGFASVTVTTEFTISTGGGAGPAAPARFTNYSLPDTGRPQMSLTGSPGRTYTIQRATRVSPGDWQTAGTVVMDGTGNGAFEDPQPGGVFPRFYRAVAN